MLSLEFSIFDLILTIAVIVLMTLFVITLFKLKPSTENNQPHEEDVLEETPEVAPDTLQPTLHQTQQQQGQPQPPAALKGPSPVSWRTQQATSFQKPVQAPQIVVNAATGGSSEESPEQALPPASEYREPPRRPEPPAVSFAAPKNSHAKDCPHKFGYLKGLPKNRPIPEECFGCERIVDCLVNKKSK